MDARIKSAHDIEGSGNASATEDKPSVTLE
jgi:hypothetical protein